MSNITDEEIKHAIYNPGAVFKRNPSSLLNEDLPLVKALSKKQKIELLERWIYDEEEREVAENENMHSSTQTSILDEILEVLRTITMEDSKQIRSKL